MCATTESRLVSQSGGRRFSASAAALRDQRIPGLAHPEETCVEGDFKRCAVKFRGEPYAPRQRNASCIRLTALADGHIIVLSISWDRAGREARAAGTAAAHCANQTRVNKVLSPIKTEPLVPAHHTSDNSPACASGAGFGKVDELVVP